MTVAFNLFLHSRSVANISRVIDVVASRFAMPVRHASESPEQRELRKKLDELAVLETELAERELQLATDRATCKEFERRYSLAVGHLFSELDELNARVAERVAAAANSNSDLREAASDARRRANQSAAAAADIQASTRRFGTSSPRAKELYRLLARTAHPDLALNEKDRLRRTAIMAEVNAAYSLGDEARLEQLLDEVQASPELVHGDGVGADLVRAIRRITQAERRLPQIAAEISSLHVTPMYDLMLRVRNAEANGVDLISTIKLDLERGILKSQDRLQRQP